MGRTQGQFIVEELPDGRECWRPRDAASLDIFAPLLATGVGGFSRLDVDATGPYAERLPAAPSLAKLLKQLQGPQPWREALELAGQFVACLQHCETHNLDPGQAIPKAVAVPDGRLHLRADSLLAQLAEGVGDTGKAGQAAATNNPTPMASRWMPPTQADGAPWDAAANRYIVGLVLYRQLAGEDAFTHQSQGLRHALAQARRGAAPMPTAITRTLPPGLHALVLRLLDPDPSNRPQSANELATRLAEFMAAGEMGSEMVASAPKTAPVRPRPTPGPRSGPGPRARATPAPRRWPGLTLLAAISIGGLATALMVSSLPEGPAVPPAATPPTIAPVRPLTAATTGADDCETCHPRQVHEWRRSVMGHSAKSPLFQALEILIEEQVGRSNTCPHGAGILRRADGVGACTDPTTGLKITGSGGALWCVNCHTPRENLGPRLPAWDGQSPLADRRRPLRDALPSDVMAGIDCGFCHQVSGPVTPGNEVQGRYEGNPFWTSTSTGQRFAMRPEDAQGKPGISNSGYLLNAATFLLGDPKSIPAPDQAGGVHRRLTNPDSKNYLRSSEFCGACHDVRIFGSDAIAARRGENFKRLRNAYSEWEAWSRLEREAGREPASCQDCHMSVYPGVCLPSASVADAPNPANTALARGCPPGTTFSPRPPGSFPEAGAATGSVATRPVTTHYFSGVDIPLAAEFPDELINQHGLDTAGVPLGAAARRDLLLGKTFRFEVDNPRRQGTKLEIPIVLENTGAGHRVPAGFSQEREFWVHLRVTDASGDTLYEVGRIDRGDEDLRDKIFLRVNTDERIRDGQGRPLGMFGADIADGPDEAQWEPPPDRGGTNFRGRGLINLQNGFLRCVTCIGTIDGAGRCQPLPGQESTRAARFADGNFDVDSGICTSNLFGENALFETYFPVGSLDATRGVVRGPDAIIDTRSAAPGVPLRYTYELDSQSRTGPFKVEARLMFRAFPPFLIRAFADYERRQASLGLRPSGALVTLDMLRRLEAIELFRVVKEIE